MFGVAVIYLKIKSCQKSGCLAEDEKAETSDTPLFHGNNTNLVKRGSGLWRRKNIVEL